MRTKSDAFRRCKSQITIDLQGGAPDLDKDNPVKECPPHCVLHRPEPPQVNHGSTFSAQQPDCWVGAVRCPPRQKLKARGVESQGQPHCWPAVRCEVYAAYGSVLTHETLCEFYISLPCIKAEHYEILVWEEQDFGCSSPFCDFKSAGPY